MKKSLSRRTVLGLVSGAVVISMAGVTTWAVADEKKPDSAPVRLIVGLKPGADTAAPMRVMSGMGAVTAMAAGGKGAKALSAIRAQAVTVPGNRKSQAIATLEADPNVAYVEVDSQVKAFGVPTDPYYVNGLQPEFARINVPAAWATTTGSADVVVAVVDSGVTEVGDLTGAVLPGYNFVTRPDPHTGDPNDYSDLYGHGTAVSSMIAARADSVGMVGVCPVCKILPVRALDYNGDGDWSDLAAAVIWAAQQGAKIINMSLGGTGDSATLRSAVAYANLRGVLVVAAAGNSGAEGDPVMYPAAYPDVLGVGGTYRSSDTRASFSNYNKAGQTYVDVAAPGYATGTLPDGSINTNLPGTSFAAPQVSGVAGLVQAQHPTYNGWGLLHSIVSTAKPLGSWVTWGKVDAARALNVATDTTAPTITGSGYGENAQVHGVVTINPSGIADKGGSGISHVDLYADGVLVSRDTTSPYQVKLDTTTGSNGPRALRIRVYDKAGNVTTYDRTVIADNTLPTLTITSAPANNAKVSGKVTINATASDNNVVNRLELIINGKVIQTDKTSPYSFVITASLQPKTMKVQVRAIDGAGNIRYAPTRNWTR